MRARLVLKHSIYLRASLDVGITLLYVIVWDRLQKWDNK